MTNATNTTKGYVLKGKILEVSDTVRKDGKMPSKKVRLESMFRGSTRQITATINPGKPMTALADKLVVGGEFKAYGIYETLPPQGDYKRGATVFRAIALPYTRQELTA